MECNKEEAIRAKGIAEEKMKKKDFLGARKIALKAQQLYPDLEHITQIIMVCEVHCSAENNVYGNEKDWYGILKIDQKADESSIKKQYRKFALLLHPDKNKYAGATDAFKLIGEAQRVLLDRDKRILFDGKYKASSRPSSATSWPPKQSCNSSNVTKQPTTQNPYMNKPTSKFPGGIPQRFPGGNPQTQQRFPGGGIPQTQQQHFPSNPPPQQPQTQKQQTGTSGDQLTFWTVCPYCYVRYQFYRNVINKLLCCQSCKRNFPGYEMNKPPMGGGSQASNGKPVPNKGARKSVGNPSKIKEPVFKTGTSSQVDKEFVVDKDNGNPGVKVKSEGQTKESKPAVKVNGKGKRKIAECSDNSDPDEDVAVDENGDVHAKKNFGIFGDSPRRSARSKPPVSYDDKHGGGGYDDNGSPLKKAKSFHVSEDPMTKDEKPDVSKSDSLRQNGSVSNDETLPNGKVDDSEHKNVESPISGASTEPEVLEYPDPDFNDFDKGRSEECFVNGQIWAVYDTIDAMPRFYARIKKVYTPGFKVRITWLEPDPDDGDELKWVSEGLPISCGRFKNGSSETTQDHLMFSHLMPWEKGSKKDSCNIRPLKGETWAIFRDWDIKWHSDPNNSKKKYEFEFVEILSEYSEADGVSVGFLGKVKGFSCLFCRIKKGGEMESLQIPSNQMLRFSHRVPSFRMSGDERKDVPRGSFEFDPASFPSDLEEVVPEEEHVNVKVEDTASDDMPCSKTSESNKAEEVEDTSEDEDPIEEDPVVGVDSFDVPDPEFYDFDKDKAPEKFQIDQIWALYSDEDGMPKYYAQIKKIVSSPEFKLHISWLVPRQLPKAKTTIKWVDKKMVVSCGCFKSQKGVSEEYTVTDAFSHQMKVECTDKKEYLIYPNEGEVWALYKDWHPGIKSSELETWDHDIVEILEVSDDHINVLFLELVDGFKSVFKAQMKDDGTMEIDRKEILRFSHQIPAYKLSDERGGSLRGYWELDPAALPVTLFCTSS